MRALRAAAAAWSLLTIIPLPGALGRRLDADDWSRSAGAFPLVGAVLALLLGGVLWVVDPRVGLLAGAVIAVFANLVLTAGLHADGLADCADALGARGTGEAQRERRLEILRDSATGSYGTLALIALVLLQVSALATLGNAFDGHPTLALLVALPVGRAAGAWHASVLPPARREGLGASFTVSAGGRRAASLSALVLVIGVAVGLWADADQDLSAALPPVLATVFAIVGTVATTRLAHAKLGGRTGDTIGATIVVAETLALLGALVAIS